VLTVGPAVRRCAVLGSPIGHSLSPVLHRAAYRELGLGWEYDALEVSSDALAGFLAGLDASWRGLSLTMPLKRTVMPLLDEASDTALTANAANTVLLGDGGRRRGHNTDVPGIERALRERGADDVTTATVVGGGATATSAVLALARMGCRDVGLLVREPARAREVVEAAGRLPDGPTLQVHRLGRPHALPEPVDVVVSTIPADAQGPLVEAMVAHAPVVFDVIYDPWPTPLARAATAAGSTVVAGLDLLVHQATRQVELMTGCDHAPLAAMRAAGEAALRRPERA
jgi:shikimate dehydrogenase